MLAATSAALLATGAMQQHPTLPTMWTATVNEAQVGTVYESYIMVDKPTPDNPSAKWTNFTDGSCQRLIYDGDNANQARYLLGCDAVTCCTETQSGDHREYQIPNIHPKFLAPVKPLGKETITLAVDKSTVDADVWEWKFGIATYWAYTTGPTLHRWVVQAASQNFTNDYVNYTVPTDVAAFKSQFRIPDVCSSARSCDGQVSAKSLKFLRASPPHGWKAAFSSASVQASAAREAPPAVRTTPLARPQEAAAKATGKLLFINGSRVVGGGLNTELISLDLSSKTTKKVSTNISSIFDYVSSSVVCGGTYYAVGTQAPVAMGIVAVDIATGKATMHPTESKLAHALACSPTEGKLLMVMSEFTQPPTFSLREYSVANQSTEVIHTFPKVSWGGWDSTFSFAKTGELWATFALGSDIMKQTSGELFIVDTATGKVKEHKKMRGAGMPYLVTPSDGDKFLWVLAKNGVSSAAEDLITCMADKSGFFGIKVSDCKPTKWLWGMGLPPAICGGTTYVAATVGMDPSVPIYSISASGNTTQVTTIDVKSESYQFGSLACGPP